MALLMAPFLMEDPNTRSSFAPDAIERAQLYLSKLNGGLGAYSDSKGNPYVRQEIANFITAETGRQKSNI
jgi:aspartate/methionine/tyrosine aminotransferase